ncbi:MAG TPA: hypothetical protein PLK55_02140 [archaeon]|nr:hypothetical protein [archaeon]
MDGFLTNSNITEPEIKDDSDIKNTKKIKEIPKKTETPIKAEPVIIKKIKEPKAPRKPNFFRALLIGLLLFGLLAGSFVAYDKHQKGELHLENISFLKFLDMNNSTPIDTNRNIMPQNNNVNLPDSNSD